MTNNGLSQLQMIEQIHERVLVIDTKLDKKAEKKDVAKLEERVRETEKDNTKVKTVGSLIILALTGLGIYK